MINKPRGTKDLLGLEALKKEELVLKLLNYAKGSGFIPLEVPTFEEKDLFIRSVGNETDIVQKELFLIANKSDKEYALRPELTAGNVRALIEAGLKSMPKPVKVYSQGNVFRYEKPQKGRYREISQLDMNIFGPKDPFSDAFSIASIYQFLKGVLDQDIIIYINSLGSRQTKDRYQNELREKAKENQAKLCVDCQKRSDSNPLRILDCKNKCIEALGEISSIAEFMDKSEKEYFETILDFFDNNNVNYETDNSLVRGLDYYTDVIFEIALIGDKERSSVVCGGGRFDNLVKDLGGFELGAFGFGIGLDRLLDILIDKKIEDQTKKIKLVATDQSKEKEAYSLALKLLRVGIETEVEPKSGLSGGLEKALKAKATYLIIVGDEIKENKVSVKNLKTKKQELIDLADLSKFLTS